MRANLLAETPVEVAVRAPEYKGLAVQAVRQTDNPEICRLQTRRYILAAKRSGAADAPIINPDISWMQARCAACGICGVGP